MPTVKQPPCCARRSAKLTMDQANLSRLAKKANAAMARNRDLAFLKAKMDECKAVIEADKAAIVDHEAEHAAGIA